MKRKIIVEVEPLSEARWAKLDEAVFDALETPSAPLAPPAPRPRSQRPLRVLGAGMFVVIAAAALILLWSRREAPPATAHLPEPSHIETGDAPSHVALGFATLDVAPSSSITTSGDEAHGMVVVLERGEVELDVAPRNERPPFVVQAGDVRVRVVGTRFAVRRSVDGRVVAVSVRHGTVEVARASEVVLLHDGDTWPKPTPPPSVAPATSSADVVAPATTTTAASSGAKSHVTDQQSYESAARLEKKDPDAAMATYRRLAGSGGPWASNSLFAAGRLAAERGQTSEARRLLEQYLARYPTGANAEDARRLLTGLR